MNEGLGYALVPIFVIVLPVIISSIILYLIFRDKKKSIIGSIIGFVGTFIIGYVLKVFWYFVQMLGSSSFAPFVILILSSVLTASAGLIIITIFQRGMK